jgi:hypothetical protein
MVIKAIKIITAAIIITLINTLINTCYKRTCGPVRYSMSKQYWTLQNNKLFDLYMSPRTVKVVKLMRLQWAILTPWIRQTLNVHRNFVGKCLEKQPLGRPSKGLDNSKIGLKLDWL